MRKQHVAHQQVLQLQVLKQLALPLQGIPEAAQPIVIPCYGKLLHSIEKPECSIASCCCHEYEKIRLQSILENDLKLDR